MFPRTIAVASTGLVLSVCAPITAAAAPVCEPSAACQVAAPAVVEADRILLPYAEPLAALGGRTLAQYLADHQARDWRLYERI